MKSKAVSGTVLILLFTGMLTLAFDIQSVKAEPETIYVDDDNISGPWNGTQLYPYQNITSALQNASVNDTVYVYNGTYYENVVIDKTLTLIGENRSNTIINGSGLVDGYLVIIRADNVDMGGFTVTNAGIIGILVEHSRYCEVHENIVCFTVDRGIVFEYGGNNSAYNNIVYNVSAHGAIEAIGSNNNTIYNNIVYFNEWGIATNHGSYNRIYNNTVHSNRASGIHIDWPSTGNMIYNNNITSNVNAGIGVIDEANGTVISGNKISESDCGIWLKDSLGNNISRNNITDNNHDGIYLRGSSNNSIVGNNLTNNDHGVRLDASSSYNIIEGNDIVANNLDGIYLNESSENRILGNNITDNTLIGVRLNESSNNSFYYNNFVDNTVQVFSNQSINTWDNGYPSGGNFWNDYAGNDTYSGPYQNETGSDGIGDTPHVIDANNKDNYPLHTSILRVPEDYSTPEKAKDAAGPRDTITIAPGVYNESLVLNKTLRILGIKGSAPEFAGGGSGIAITIEHGASGSVVAGIVITNWDQGIFIDNSSDCKIYDNIMSMDHSGIALEGNNAANNIIYSNIFEGNNLAINLTESSTSNTIYANTISQNDVGIDMSNSNDNIIYHNNFVDNTQQVSVSDSSGNVWDNGYPNGGNYWSNYTGVDANGDGIGDTPHVIDANNKDRYPLMNPWPCEITPLTSVGGVYIPVNKLELLAPYIELTMLLAATVVTVVYVKKRKRHTETNCMHACMMVPSSFGRRRGIQRLYPFSTPCDIYTFM